MGMDMFYKTSKLLTKQELEDLMNGKLYFENYYSLDLITKEEAENIKKINIYDTLMKTIIPNESYRQDFLSQLEEYSETTEEYIIDEYMDKDEIPCSWEQKINWIDNCCDVWTGIDTISLNYNGEELYLLLYINYG